MRIAALVLPLALAVGACDRPAASTTVTHAATATAAARAADPALDDPLVGTTPAVWKTESWIDSAPLSLADLRGKVVLVRWFMGPACPYCSATAPSLEKLHETYASRGLVVVGLYHDRPPPRAPTDDAELRAIVRGYRFTFPVARDPGWQTLHAWWLDDGKREFTSAAFLLDRRGRVRGVHPGPRFAPGDPDYEAIRRGVEALLAER